MEPLKRQKDIQKDFTFERNTFKRVVKEEKKNKIDLEVGDSKEDDFKPQAKVMRWDNDVNFSIRRIKEDKNVSVKTDKDKIIYEDDDEDVVFYEHDDVGEDGGIEMELHIKKRPDITQEDYNKFSFSIRSKGLKAYYQGKLTAEEIESGLSRPENVVDSWALYHANDRNNVYRPLKREKYNASEVAQGKQEGWIIEKEGKEYELNKDIKTGKFAHLYRPHAVDAEGNEAWGIIMLPRDGNHNLIDGQMDVYLPYDFIKNAIYPIIIDPTFGYTSIGASESLRNGTTKGSKFTAAAEDGDVIKHTVAGYNDLASIDIRSAAYGDSAGTADNLIASESATGTAGTTNAFIDVTISYAFTASDIIWLLADGDGGTSMKLAYDVGATNQGLESSSGSWPSPMSNDSYNNRQYSIYATYTAAATETDSSRPAETHGQNTANAERDAETHGSDTSNSERDAQVTGSQSANATRSAEVTGVTAPVLEAVQNGEEMDLTWTYNPNP